MGAFSQKSFPVKLVTVFLHVAGWMALLLIPMMLHPAPRHLSEFSNPELVLLMMVIFQLAHIAFFYFNYHVLVPRFLLNRQYLKFIVLLIVGLIIVQSIPHLFTHFVLKDIMPMNRDFRRAGKFMTITFGLLIVASSTGFRLLSDWLKLESEARELSNEKLMAELSYLKAQIDPHFFFNTLNGIYSLSITQPEKVSDYLLRLSHFMRFVINEDTAKLISIEDEVQHLKDYIELQKLRLTDKTSIDFTIELEDHSIKLSPHLFLPFIENAIKYGVSNNKNSNINISLKTKASQVFFEIGNFKLRENSDVGSNLIGIKNVKRRLELIYPSKHRLEILDESERFQVNLQISTV